MNRQPGHDKLNRPIEINDTVLHCHYSGGVEGTLGTVKVLELNLEKDKVKLQKTGPRQSYTSWVQCSSLVVITQQLKDNHKTYPEAYL